MKAKDWVAKYTPETHEEFFKAYAEETAKLIEVRTKGSGVSGTEGKVINTKPGAIDGALREQRQKWQAICQKVNGSLTIQMFDTDVVGFHMPAIVLEQQKWKEKSKNYVKSEAALEPGSPGRKLVVV